MPTESIQQFNKETIFFRVLNPWQDRFIIIRIFLVLCSRSCLRPDQDRYYEYSYLNFLKSRLKLSFIDGED